MSIAKFKVHGSLDRGGGSRAGTVTIDRSAGTFKVRPLRSRREYVASLSTVADIIVEKIIKAEVREKQKEKKLRRKRDGNHNSR
jgi:hypothetical protein